MSSSDASARFDAAQTSSAGADAALEARDAALDAASGLAQGRDCKRGVAYNHELAADAPVFGKTIGWWYDWSPVPDSSVVGALQAANVELVPMVWSAPPTRTLDAQQLIDTIPKGTRYLLAFNEPNFGHQASLTPEQAAAAWPQLEQVARARNLLLVSPAVNYCGGDCNQTDPFAWLDAFFAACSQCQIDYVAFHWYACSLDALKSIVGKYESRYGKPVWLTEFACLDDPGDHSAAGQLAYMKQAVPFLESDPKVFRYAWFIGRSSQPAANDLFAAPGALTALGSAYATLPGACH
ncbi:MAG TPA: glycoside hydrolase family protein [Polyangiales bacterium]|nr:glycoside hydrolase family protein [Polyangiales bacterium]